MANFGHKLARRLVINMVRVLGSGLHTPTHFFFGSTPRAVLPFIIGYHYQVWGLKNQSKQKSVVELWPL